MNVTRSLGIALFFMGATTLSAADDEASEELLRCGAIADDAKRLACYDALSGRASAAEAESSEEPYAPLTDDVGKEQLSSSDRDRDRDREERQAIRATVTGCQQDANHKYYFIFDNGQVWKQKDSGRLQFGECSFGATITRDMFGYRMQADGKSRRVRISRVK